MERGSHKVWMTFTVSLLLLLLAASVLNIQPSAGSVSFHGLEQSAPSSTRAAGDARASTALDDLRYLAIGPSSFGDELAPLIQWKTQKGVKAGFYPLDGETGILNSTPGRDVQEKIRTFIRDMKDKNPYLQWVLLAGDGEVIPSRRIFVNGTAEFGADEDDNYVLSDYYYAGLDGSWDINDNGIFGEEDEQDWYADVYVGRFPASDERELSIMVNRQLGYEKDPPPGAWSSSALLAGSLMDAPNNKDLFDPYKDNAYEVVLEVEEGLPPGVTPFHLLDYPRFEWGGYNRMFDNLNRSSFTAHYEMGYSTVLMACHGDNNGNCTSYKGDGGGSYPYWADYDVYFDYDTANTIENGRRTPLVYISNCDSLNFSETDDTNMERIMTNPNGGAIGIIGATVTTFRGEFRDENSYGNWWLAKEFYRILYGGTPRPGKALYTQKQNYIPYIFSQTSFDPEEFKRIFYIDNLAYNLLGDPEGPIWLDTPGELSIDFPARYYQDNTTFRAEVRDGETGEALPGAVVTLMDPRDGNVYISDITDQSGIVEFNYGPDSLGEVNLTVVKEGYIPSVGRVEVVSQKNLALVGGLGLDPPVPVFGQPLMVSVIVRNDGEVDLDNVLLRMELSAKEGVQRPDKHLEHLGVGEEVEINLSFEPYRGVNTLKAEVHLLSGSMEKSLDDNVLVREVRVNDPIYFGASFPNLVTLEDLRLSEFGELFNLSHYIVDQDSYPEEMTIWAEAVKGNLTPYVSDDGLLEIVPGRDWNGEGILRIYASDGSVTASSDLRVYVESVNDPPSFREWPSSLEALEDVPVSFLVEIVDVDSPDIELSSPDLEDVTFTPVDNSSNHVFNVSFTPTEELVGSSFLVLLASDGGEDPAEVRISLIVRTSNDPPEVTHPEKVTSRIGESIRVPLEIFDPDNDKEIRVGAEGSIVKGYQYSDGYLVVDIESGVSPGTYVMEIWVDDNNTGGNVTFNVEVDIKEKEKENFFAVTVILVILILAVLLIYGAFIRYQETKQKRVLSQVEEEVKAIKPRRRRSKREGRGRGEQQRDRDRQPKKGAISAPPAPSDIEGELARKELPELEEGASLELDDSSLNDMESDLEEVIQELFP